ncbi:hypothetical protein LOTGIDRAFT_117098 [Lottia gigantea]|uniref:Nudix hydrolase domain-containing protein n=1 Tax=Lottia gigantea TaxID=225164 RepID=V3ZV70_LOTGI|nr:hypothetical protein LOTGIDRAFT_117098 [Lottia gigantea]ESO95373.1 hypothetical protein LOTGIDRAFT_117098 [Lottia gigantea]
MSKSIHQKARTSPYPRTKDIIRTKVADDNVPWKVEYDYKPVKYTSESVLKGPVWADPDIKPGDKHNIQFNTVDNNVNRTSFICKYEVVNSLPRNPMGRTGLTGRGSLGRWGPNHAADPIVTRWKNKDKKILQFVAVQRKDNGEWAIPGGMVDAGEVVSQTLRREFGEEALNTLEADSSEKKHIEQSLDRLFHSGTEIFKGYVDDPRNTDNAWMETVAMNFHDELGDSAGLFELNAGDDAMSVQWMDITNKSKLYASHEHFIQSVAQLHKAEW